MLPYLDVIDLPQSTSFFSAVCQPLGLRYISSSTIPGGGEDSNLRSVTFGASPAHPLFQIRQAADPPPSQPPAPLKRSRVVLSAPSADAVRDIHAFALRAHPESASSIRPTEPNSEDPSQEPGIQASITDLDGNKMAVVYLPPPNYDRHYSGDTFRRTQSTDKEAASIMSWNYDVASSSASHVSTRLPVARRSSAVEDPLLDDRPYTTMMRHTYTSTTSVPSAAPSIRESSKGLTTAGIAGVIGMSAAVGAVAGAALTYNLTMREKARAPRQEFDPAPPPFSRRSTFPDPAPYPRESNYIEVERTVEKIRGYPEDVFGTYRPSGGPTHIARYGRAGGSPPRTIVSTSRDEIDYDEGRRGRHHPPSSSSSHRLHRPRTRSESAPRSRAAAPLLLTDTEHRSFTGSSHERAPIPPPSRVSVRRAATYDEETYVSARSRRSSSTVRPPAPSGVIALPPPPIGSHSHHSHSGSVRGPGSSHSRASTIKAPAVKSYVSARNVPLPMSHVSARNVPLPPSRVGSRRGSSWEDEDGDADSVAPSDSISCVGSRRSGRRYH